MYTLHGPYWAIVAYRYVVHITGTMHMASEDTTDPRNLLDPEV